MRGLLNFLKLKSPQCFRIQNITRYLKLNGVQVVFTADVFKNSTMEYYMEQLKGMSAVARGGMKF